MWSARPGPLRLTGFSGSGADWLEGYKPFIEDGKAVVVSPHKVAFWYALRLAGVGAQVEDYGQVFK